MNQTRTISISARDLAMLITGSAIVLLLRVMSTDTKAATPDLGLSCGEWVIQTDQRTAAGGDFDAFILNVKTGELLRTRSAGKEVMTVVKK